MVRIQCILAILVSYSFAASPGAWTYASERADEIPFREFWARSSILSIAYSPDGKLLATGFAMTDDEVKIWDAETFKLVATLSDHVRRVNQVGFSPDGSLLASASEDHTVRLWNTKTWKARQVLSGHKHEVKTFAFLGEDQILTGSRDRTMRIWSLSTGETLSVISPEVGMIGAVASATKADSFAVFGSKRAKVWNRQRRIAAYTLPFSASSYSSADASATGRLIAFTGHSLGIRVWSMEEQGKKWAFRLPYRHPTFVQFSPNGRILAGVLDPFVMFFDSSTGAEKLRLAIPIPAFDPSLPPDAHPGYRIMSVAWRPDGREFAAGCAHSKVRIWNLENAFK